MQQIIKLAIALVMLGSIGAAHAQVTAYIDSSDPDYPYLVIEGSNQADDVQVVGSKAQGLSVLSDSKLIFCSEGQPIQTIEFYGLNGDDRFENMTDVAVMAEGNSGNDTLIGGSSSDVLSGGPGRDNLFGQVGDDLIFGDAGNDKIIGGLGQDQLFAGTGEDQVIGDEDDIVATVAVGADFMMFAD